MLHLLADIIVHEGTQTDRGPTFRVERTSTFLKQFVSKAIFVEQKRRSELPQHELLILVSNFTVYCEFFEIHKIYSPPKKNPVVPRILTLVCKDLLKFPDHSQQFYERTYCTQCYRASLYISFCFELSLSLCFKVAFRQCQKMHTHQCHHKLHPLLCLVC